MVAVMRIHMAGKNNASPLTHCYCTFSDSNGWGHCSLCPSSSRVDFFWHGLRFDVTNSEPHKCDSQFRNSYKI